MLTDGGSPKNLTDLSAKYSYDPIPDCINALGPRLCTIVTLDETCMYGYGKQLHVVPAHPFIWVVGQLGKPTTFPLVRAYVHRIESSGPVKDEYIDKGTKSTAQRCYMRE